MLNILENTLLIIIKLVAIVFIGIALLIMFLINRNKRLKFMDFISDLELERLLKNNSDLIHDYLGKNKAKTREYVMSHPKEKRIMVLKDLIKVALMHKRTDPD